MSAGNITPADRAAAAAVLPKPFDLDDLFAAIERATGLRSAG